MPKKRSSAKKRTVRRAAVGARRVGRRVQSGTHGMKWGEVALSALVGYFSPKIVESTPIPSLVVSRFMTNAPPNSPLNAAYAAMPQYANDPNGWVSDESMKFLGFLAVAKSGYDVVKHKHLSSEDKDVLIPFAVGALLAPKSGNTVSGGGW